MYLQSLSGEWEFKQAGSDEWLPANVPGGVHTDLLALSLIPDPFAGDNELRVKWVAEADWIYRHSFICAADLLDEEKIVLTCDGLDTLATVRLNGTELGTTSNMFRRYEWDVKQLLRKGSANQLEVTFASPVKFAAQHQAERPLLGVPQAIPGGPHLRKAPCQFGWDWGPQLPSMGIWKDIRLEGYTTARIDDIHLRQEHQNGDVAVEITVVAQRNTEDQLFVAASIQTPGGKLIEAQANVDGEDVGKLSIVIPEPELWWPNGFGDQPLYLVEVSLLRNSRSRADVLDRKTFKIGLRTIELRQEEDNWGRSFEFVINGVRIFAKGANWIPADSFPTRLTDEHLENLIRSAADSHQNMLRVWGGGFYEEERFYDLCDRYGILVWQEFIFSCSIYPLDKAEFVENVHIEAVQNIRRLRHRASLAVWCGNNEMESGWVEWGWNMPDYQELKAAYEQFFHHILPGWCQAEDPDHGYWPSSPSSGAPFFNPNSVRQGDAHYWDVWHGRKPFTAYRSQYPRFMSEFGFQSLPPLSTIRTFADEKDWNMTSYIMEQHQKNASGNSIIVAQMLDNYRLPLDFRSMVYLSMVLQAEGIRYGVEHWRRHPERIAGTLYWQLNDCWPVASWSSLDYFGRWKALHYAARRFYAPLMLSIEDKPPEMGVYITNDLRETREGLVKWSLETTGGNRLASGEVPFTAPPQAACLVFKQDFSGYVGGKDARQAVFIAELWQNDRLLSCQVATFIPIKHLSLEDPAIEANLHETKGSLVIELCAHALALAVELSFEGADVLFSDNYFHLPAGRLIHVSCPMPVGWTLETARKRFQLCSVYDSYSPD